MPQILFVVEIPPIPDGTRGANVSPAWSCFVNEADTKIALVKTYTRLQPNAWLLPAENTLPLLAELVALASKDSLSYSAVLIPDGTVMLALDQKPKA